MDIEAPTAWRVRVEKSRPLRGRLAHDASGASLGFPR